MPSLAKEAHQAAIDTVIEDTLERANVRMEDLSAVAVTVGPGLSMCLKVCLLYLFCLALSLSRLPFSLLPPFLSLLPPSLSFLSLASLSLLAFVSPFPLSLPSVLL